LAVLAVIEPLSPVVRSWMTTWKPALVSCMSTTSLSPLLYSSVSALTTACSPNGVNGLAGATGMPLLVTAAQLTGSGPCEAWHAGLFGCPVFMFSGSLSIVSAEHHLPSWFPNPSVQLIGPQPGG
jgi:hypothetical protein